MFLNGNCNHYPTQISFRCLSKDKIIKVKNELTFLCRSVLSQYAALPWLSESLAKRRPITPQNAASKNKLSIAGSCPL